MLTLKQKRTKDFVTEIIIKKGIAPSEREVARHFRISASTAHGHLEMLLAKGYLQKEPGRARGIKVTEPDIRLVQIPLRGVIAAGQLREAIETRETIAIPQSRLPFSNGDYYALRVSGDSMIEEDINDGDVVLIKGQNTAKNGEKVVALVDNSEATLKKFYKEKNHIRLEPANKTLEPIIVPKNTPFAIQGIVVEVIGSEKTQQTEKAVITYNVKRERKLPLNEIILGDAIRELRKLPNESCDIIIADPPYNIGKDFGNNTDKKELTEYIGWCKSWIDECIRVLKPNGTMFVYGFSEILAYLSVEIPLQKRWLIWHYTNKNVASLHFWQRSHEAIICAWKDRPIFNRDDIREPYTEGFLNGAAGKVRRGTIGRFSKNGKETVYKAHEGGALPRDVIKIPALAGGAGMNERWFMCQTCNKDVFQPRELKKHLEHEIIKHPTQKPLEISKKLILSALPKKEGTVLVPFVGSGAECRAAKELGQNYIGFEINPDYVKIAKKVVSSV